MRLKTRIERLEKQSYMESMPGVIIVPGTAKDEDEWVAEAARYKEKAAVLEAEWLEKYCITDQ